MKALNRLDPEWLRITADYMQLYAKMIELGAGHMVKDSNYPKRVALITYDKGKGLVHQTPLNEPNIGAMKYRPVNMINRGVVLYTQCNHCIMYCELDLNPDTCNIIEVYSKQYNKAAIVSLDSAHKLLDSWADARPKIDNLCK